MADNRRKNEEKGARSAKTGKPFWKEEPIPEDGPEMEMGEEYLDHEERPRDTHIDRALRQPRKNQHR